MMFAFQFTCIALLLGETVAERKFAAFEKYIDRGCQWDSSGTCYIAELSGRCSQVTIDADSTDFLNSTWTGTTTVGQRYSLVGNRYVLAETYSDTKCNRLVSQLHYPIDQCLNLTAQRITLQRPLLDYAIVTVLDSKEGQATHNKSAPEMVYASAVYYPTGMCEGAATPYPIMFIPGTCYKNITDILPPELQMLKGAQYPPLFPLAAVRATVSRDFLNFFFFADEKCTIHRDTAQSVSFRLEDCTRLTSSSTVHVSINNMSIYDMPDVAELSQDETFPTRAAFLSSAAAHPRLPLAGFWSAVVATIGLVHYL